MADNVSSVIGKASAWSADFRLDEFDGRDPAMVKAAAADVWSPFEGGLTEVLLEQANALGLKVILITQGVDGIITDDPDVLREVAKALGLELPVPASTQ